MMASIKICFMAGITQIILLAAHEVDVKHCKCLGFRVTSRIALEQAKEFQL
jgi:hypothetical protein